MMKKYIAPGFLCIMSLCSAIVPAYGLAAPNADFGPIISVKHRDLHTTFAKVYCDEQSVPCLLENENEYRPVLSFSKIGKAVRPDIRIETVDKQYYVSASALNVRTGPGTEHDIITTIAMNTQVHATGLCENGWYRVKVNGVAGYVSGSYLSATKIVYQAPSIQKPSSSSQPDSQETVLEEMARRGNLGRLYINSCGINVALFYASIYSGNHSQQVVDNWDSAAYMANAAEYYGYELIGDHVHQGFSGIKSAVPGSTRATMDFGTYTRSLICVAGYKGYNGYNGESGLFRLDGTPIIGGEGRVCMYTCNSDGTIYITFWNYC